MGEKEKKKSKQYGGFDQKNINCIYAERSYRENRIMKKKKKKKNKAEI